MNRTTLLCIGLITAPLFLVGARVKRNSTEQPAPVRSQTIVADSISVAEVIWRRPISREDVPDISDIGVRGNAIVALSSLDHHIAVFESMTGSQIDTLGSIGQGQDEFLAPQRFVVIDNNIWILDAGNRRLIKWVGNAPTASTVEIHAPMRIAQHVRGVAALDWKGGNVLVFDETGKQTRSIRLHVTREGTPVAFSVISSNTFAVIYSDGDTWLYGENGDVRQRIQISRDTGKEAVVDVASASRPDRLLVSVGARLLCLDPNKGWSTAYRIQLGDTVAAAVQLINGSDGIFVQTHIPRALMKLKVIC